MINKKKREGGKNKRNEKVRKPVEISNDSIQVLVINGNPGMYSDTGDDIPNYLKPAGTSVKANLTDDFSCYAFTRTSQSIIVEIDAAYLNYSHCQCDLGYVLPFSPRSLFSLFTLLTYLISISVQVLRRAQQLFQVS